MIRMTQNDQISVLQCNVDDLPALLVHENSPRINDHYREIIGKEIAGAKKRRNGMYTTEAGIELGDIGTVEQAKALVEKGWLEGEQRARREIHVHDFAHLTPNSVDRRRKRRIGDEGDELRLDAAMQGNWDTAWERREKRFVATPNVVSIGCAFGGPSMIGHDEMFWNGAQMAVLSGLLEEAGWRVELRALKVNRMNNGDHLQDWLVKRADQPARDDLILALFGHAGVYRIYGWAGNCFREKRTPSMGGGVDAGKVIPVSAAAVDAGLTAPLSLVIPQAFSREKAIANIRNALQHFGKLATAA